MSGIWTMDNGYWIMGKFPAMNSDEMSLDIPNRAALDRLLQSSHRLAEYIPPRIIKGYSWFSSQNEQVFLQHVSAMLSAYQVRMWSQIGRNATQLVHSLDRDRADHAASLVSEVPRDVWPFSPHFVGGPERPDLG